MNIESYKLQRPMSHINTHQLDDGKIWLSGVVLFPDVTVEVDSCQDGCTRFDFVRDGRHYMVTERRKKMPTKTGLVRLARKALEAAAQGD